MGGKMTAINTKYECDFCNREIKENEFMAVLGKAPPQGLSAPIGRADAILDQIGEIYCGECFQERFRDLRDVESS
jgi:hypothetical protein